MARLARVVVPGIPHYVTQRGNRRQRTFFSDADRRMYMELMAEWCERCGVEVWAYCLMPNHVHLIAMPSRADGLRLAIGEAHRRYTQHVNLRKGWRGHLWQGRFASFPMDDPYLLTAACYIELNPVRARLVTEAPEYLWSSAAAHLRGCNDGLVKVEPLLALTGDWGELLTVPLPTDSWDAFRRHERTGRPLGGEGFVAHLENTLGRVLKPQRPGRRRKGAKHTAK